MAASADTTRRRKPPALTLLPMAKLQTRPLTLTHSRPHVSPAILQGFLSSDALLEETPISNQNKNVSKKVLSSETSTAVKHLVAIYNENAEVFIKTYFIPDKSKLDESSWQKDASKDESDVTYLQNRAFNEAKYQMEAFAHLPKEIEIQGELYVIFTPKLLRVYMSPTSASAQLEMQHVDLKSNHKVFASEKLKQAFYEELIDSLNIWLNPLRIFHNDLGTHNIVVFDDNTICVYDWGSGDNKFNESQGGRKRRKTRARKRRRR